MSKRTAEEMSSFAPNYQRVEAADENSDSFSNNMYSSRVTSSHSGEMGPTRDNFSSRKDFSLTESSSPTLISWNDDTTSFPDSCHESTSATEYLNTFFQGFNTSETSTTPSSPSKKLKVSNEEVPSPTSKFETSILPPVNSVKTRNLKVFHQELGDCFYLTLKLNLRQYFVHIREFKPDMFSDEDIPTKNGVCMDIQSWYEFQSKIVAFNMRYKSSSFVANNTILVLNQNSFMQIKNLKNYSHIILNEHQLLKLKENMFRLNNALLHHMYTKQIPSLIKQKCAVRKLPAESESHLHSKLITCIENNMVTLLNRLYECSGCALRHASESLHVCCVFNNREKFNQLGEALLMLIDFDFVISTFLNGVDCVSEKFLFNIHVETIQNVLFKTD